MKQIESMENDIPVRYVSRLYEVPFGMVPDPALIGKTIHRIDIYDEKENLQFNCWWPDESPFPNKEHWLPRLKALLEKVKL